MRALVWLFRAAVFFVLFAFALNNQQQAVIHWFFGQEWHAPMVFIVLASFAFGCAFGVVAMVPSWWRHRRIARRQAPAVQSGSAASAAPQSATAPAPLEPLLEHPPRDGL